MIKTILRIIFEILIAILLFILLVQYILPTFDKDNTTSSIPGIGGNIYADNTEPSHGSNNSNRTSQFYRDSISSTQGLGTNIRADNRELGDGGNIALGVTLPGTIIQTGDSIISINIDKSFTIENNVSDINISNENINNEQVTDIVPEDCFYQTVGGEETDYVYIAHNNAIRTYQSPKADIDNICVGEIRVCRDGVLQGGYEYLDCNYTIDGLNGTEEMILGAGQTSHGLFNIVKGRTAAYELIQPFNTQSNPNQLFTTDGRPVDIIPNTGRVIWDNNLQVVGDFTREDFVDLPSGNITGSCTLPWGDVISHGEYGLAYESSKPKLGESCIFEQRVCLGGVLQGSFRNKTCTLAKSTIIEPSTTLAIPKLGNPIIITNDNPITQNIPEKTYIKPQVKKIDPIITPIVPIPTPPKKPAICTGTKAKITNMRFETMCNNPLCIERRLGLSATITYPKPISGTIIMLYDNTKYNFSGIIQQQMKVQGVQEISLILPRDFLSKTNNETTDLYIGFNFIYRNDCGIQYGFSSIGSPFKTTIETTGSIYTGGG